MVRKGIFKTVGLSDEIKDIDKPFDTPFFNTLFKKNKLRVVFIFEDGSYTEKFVKVDSDYFITINSRKYHVVPKTILRGKNPMIMFYNNNPLPIHLPYQHSSLKAIDLQSKDKLKKMTEEQKVLLSNVVLDAGAIDSAFSAHFLKGLYGNTGLTTKQIILIMVVAVVILLVILQITGKIDIGSLLGGG